MLEIQNKYIQYLGTLKSKLKEANFPEKCIEDLAIDILMEQIKGAELLIPVVGAFSSGKSSLLNSFLGKDYLPVGITPETSLATELRFVPNSEDEIIEAITKKLSVERYEIDQISRVSENAPKYKFMRLYIHNDQLKKIEPLILVDMPGFDSPLDLHNQAIMEYIDKGVHYIVLISVEDGTITRSMERQLQDIRKYNRDFTFLLSKTNLRSEDEAESVRQMLIHDIKDIFDMEKDVIAIGDNGGQSFEHIMSTINPNTLFKSLFIDDLKNISYSSIDTINTLISSLQRDKNENLAELKTLENSLESVIQKRDTLIKEAQDKYSDVNINRIIENIGNELTGSIDELTNLLLTGGKDAFSSAISEIVRSRLLSEIKNFLTDVGQDIVDEFSLVLTDSESSFTLTDQTISHIQESTRLMLNKFNTGLKSIVERTNQNKQLYRIVTGILAITTSVVNPLIEILIIALPDILQAIVGKFQRQQQESNVRTQLTTIIIPGIKRKLRAQLAHTLNTQINNMIRDISEHFEHKINAKKATIESARTDFQTKISDIDGTINKYESLLNEIKLLVSSELLN